MVPRRFSAQLGRAEEKHNRFVSPSVLITNVNQVVGFTKSTVCTDLETRTFAVQSFQLTFSGCLEATSKEL